MPETFKATHMTQEELASVTETSGRADWTDAVEELFSTPSSVYAAGALTAAATGLAAHGKARAFALLASGALGVLAWLKSGPQQGKP